MYRWAFWITQDSIPDMYTHVKAELHRQQQCDPSKGIILWVNLYILNKTENMSGMLVLGWLHACDNLCSQQFRVPLVQLSDCHKIWNHNQRGIGGEQIPKFLQFNPESPPIPKTCRFLASTFSKILPTCHCLYNQNVSFSIRRPPTWLIALLPPNNISHRQLGLPPPPAPDSSGRQHSSMTRSSLDHRPLPHQHLNAAHCPFPSDVAPFSTSLAPLRCSVTTRLHPHE